MNLWQRILALLRPPAPADERAFALDEQLSHSLYELAARERRPAHEVAARLLEQALHDRRETDQAWGQWQSLTPREQDVAALICLGLTSRQIAARLGISPETVKTHAGRILEKFELRTRRDLRALLSEWDFSAWNEIPPES